MAKAKNPKTEFKKLQAKWYKKIKDELDFEDIESDEFNLKRSSLRLHTGTHYSAEVREAKEEYYRFAEHYLTEGTFSSELERVIWEYHVNALSNRDIANILKKAKITNISGRTVDRIVERLAAAMKRKYLAGNGQSEQ